MKKITYVFLVCLLSYQLFGSYLYWSWGDECSILKSETGSNQYETVLSDVTRSASGIQVDHTNNYIYWSQLGGRNIYRAHPDGSDLEIVVTGSSSFSFINDVELDVANGKMYYNSYRQNEIRRAN